MAPISQHELTKLKKGIVHYYFFTDPGLKEDAPGSVIPGQHIQLIVHKNRGGKPNLYFFEPAGITIAQCGKQHLAAMTEGTQTM